MHIMLRYYSIITILLALAAISSCKKDTVATPPVNTDSGSAQAIIVSSIPDSVYITLSGHDIKTGTIPHILNLVLPPQDTLVLPRTDMRNAHKYQYTWHTADYRYSNWFITSAEGYPVKQLFDYYGKESDYMLSINGMPRNELLICLGGNGQSTSWQAVDAYNKHGVSVWDTLADRIKDHSFMISRYHTVRHTFRDSLNKSLNTNLAFMLNTTAARMWLSVNHPSDAYVLTNDISDIAALSVTDMDILYYCRTDVDSTGTVIYPEPYYKIARTSVER